MPVSPDFAADLAKKIREIYVDAEQQLLDRMAGYLAQGIDLPDWAERQLAVLQRLRTAIDQVMAAATATGSAALIEAVRFAYNRGVATAGTDLAALGEVAAIAFGGVDMDAVQALVEAQQPATEELRRGALRIASSAPIEYRSILDRVAGRMLSGTGTRRDAAAQVMREFADRGITKFTDTTGRNWDLASYAEMATRTAAGQAAVQGHVDRLAETGRDLVMVSDAPEECVKCRPWEGKVLSISGQTRAGRQDVDGHQVTVAGTLRQATSDGLFHPNCRHRTVVYVPGRTKPLTDTADPDGDKLRQAQRAKERRVRELKRRVAALEPLGDTAELRSQKAKLRAYTADFAAWREKHGRKNLAYRVSLTSR